MAGYPTTHFGVGRARTSTAPRQHSDAAIEVRIFCLQTTIIIIILLLLLLYTNRGHTSLRSRAGSKSSSMETSFVACARQFPFFEKHSFSRELRNFETVAAAAVPDSRRERRTRSHRYAIRRRRRRSNCLAVCWICLRFW